MVRKNEGMKSNIPIRKRNGVLPKPESNARGRDMIKDPIITSNNENRFGGRATPIKNMVGPIINLIRLNIRLRFETCGRNDGNHMRNPSQQNKP